MERSDDSFEKELETFRPILVSLAEALISPEVRGHVEASDLVQQTMLEAHAHADRLRHIHQTAFFNRLRQALKHNVLDAVKSLKAAKHDIARSVRESDLEESFARLDQLLCGDQTSPSQAVQRDEQITTMLTSLQALPTNQRLAIIGKHLRGKSLKEVAADLGLSESATAGLLHPGRQHLLRLMGGTHDE